jgi:RNA ligase (TIGR02306 family)
VGGLNSYEKGEVVIFVPPDCILPSDLEERVFAGTRMQRSGDGRVKTAKIRGVVSQGLIISLTTAGLPQNTKEGINYADWLGIKKWEPPAPVYLRGTTSKILHRDFKRYTDIENIKNFDRVFNEGEQISATIKLHGTSFRAGYAKRIPKNWVEKLAMKLKLISNYEFVVGSRNTELQSENQKTYYDENLYWLVAKQYRIKDKLKPEEFVYGEIVGKLPGGKFIQANFDYGYSNPTLFVYDAVKNGKYLSVKDFQKFINGIDLPKVPVIYEGPYSEEVINKIKGESNHFLDSKVPCREGVVIKSIEEDQHPILGRKVLKAINDNYYFLKGNTEFH